MARGGDGAGRGRAEGEAFWRFSLAFYARPGVAGALIGLQDRGGCDVNLALFGLWLGTARRRRLNPAELAAAEAACAPLRDRVVAVLRGLRRRLRPDPDPDIDYLRQRIEALELIAEKQVQYRLAGSLPAREHDVEENDRLASAEANLALCLGPEHAASAEAAIIRRALVEFTARR